LISNGLHGWPGHPLYLTYWFPDVE
jgi:hypothetical protein